MGDQTIQANRGGSTPGIPTATCGLPKGVSFNGQASDWTPKATPYPDKQPNREMTMASGSPWSVR